MVNVTNIDILEIMWQHFTRTYQIFMNFTFPGWTLCQQILGMDLGSCSNVLDSGKTSPTMKCKAVNAYIKKKAQISNLSLPRQKGERRPNSKVEEGMKIVKIRSQINIQKRKTKEIIWRLANFGVLQRAPETSQREILNYLSSLDMLNYMGRVVRKSDESSHVILYGWWY